MANPIGIDISTTYKGFRLQALYILFLALSQEGRWKYFPEKVEDLTVEDENGNLKTLVQIKSSYNNISLSTFEPQQKHGFFKRIEKIIQVKDEVEIFAKCFGTVSQELILAFNKGDKEHQQRIRDKLKKFGYSDQSINAFFTIIRFEELDENVILEEVANIIEKTIVGAQPAVALDLLTKWIYDLSEIRKGFTKNTLINQIHCIGKFLKDLRAHHATWFNVIKPFSEFNVKNVDKNTFEEAFIEGSSTRFEHILLDLDIKRKRQLELISKGFDEKNIVIVHGASGQGKTTLAFRYIKESHPVNFSFYIKKVTDFEASVNISHALLEYSKKLSIPILIYYDVEAYNPNWVHILEELAHRKNIKILITIREENWRMSNVNYHSFPFKDIELSFGQDEAMDVYQMITQKLTVAVTLNFQDSWISFGAKGPLLEYVYYLRKTRTLKSRLNEQLHQLERRRGKEYLDFLAAIALITKYGVRVNLEKLLASVDCGTPMNLLYELEKEYLIRIVHEGNNKLIEAMHPIRSNIIYEILFNEGIFNWFDYFRKSLEMCHSNDLQYYLLNVVYDRFNFLEDINSFFLSYHIKTWNELHAIYKALQWADMKNYYLSNQNLINEIFQKLNTAWYVVFDFNIGRIKSHDGAFWKKLDGLSDELKFEYENFSRQQSPKRDALKLSEQFLKRFSNYV